MEVKKPIEGVRFLQVEECDAPTVNLFATQGFMVKARGSGPSCRVLCGFDN